MSQDISKEILCPSFSYQSGSRLLGVRQSDGTISILPKPLEIDDEAFIKKSNEGVHLERQFRFVNNCQESKCKQWTGKKCSIAPRVLHFVTQAMTTEIPECSIRP